MFEGPPSPSCISKPHSPQDPPWPATNFHKNSASVTSKPILPMKATMLLSSMPSRLIRPRAKGTGSGPQALKLDRRTSGRDGRPRSSTHDARRTLNLSTSMSPKVKRIMVPLDATPSPKNRTTSCRFLIHKPSPSERKNPFHFHMGGLSIKSLYII